MTSATTNELYSPCYLDPRIAKQLESIVFDNDQNSRHLKAYRLMQIIYEIEQEVA
jgi:hypothetical protein